MDAATAWAEAMKFENRPNPYPYFEELRKTPVAKVSDKTYVVTGYPELLALAHDPRISSDISRSPSGMLGEKPDPEPGAEDMASYGKDVSIIVSDPPDHDRMRRQVMRHFGPPHSPDLIPSMEPFIVELANDLLDRVAAEGKSRLDVVDDFAYPIPVVGDLPRSSGVPVADEPKFHGWIFDFMKGTDLGPERDTEEGRRVGQKAVASTAELDALPARPGRTVCEGAGRRAAVGTAARRRAGRADVGGGDASNASLLLVAGHDSTVNTITNCVMTLLRNPGSWDLVRYDPELIPRTIEEVQRLQSAVQFFPSRSATADIDIAGTRDPGRVGGVPGVGGGQPRPAPVPEPGPVRPDARGQRALRLRQRHPHLLSVGRWHAWRSTSRWRSSCAGCARRSWWSTRRRTGTTRCFADLDICGWISR